MKFFLIKSKTAPWFLSLDSIYVWNNLFHKARNPIFFFYKITWPWILSYPFKSSELVYWTRLIGLESHLSIRDYSDILLEGLLFAKQKEKLTMAEEASWKAALAIILVLYICQLDNFSPPSYFCPFPPHPLLDSFSKLYMLIEEASLSSTGILYIYSVLHIKII